MVLAQRPLSCRTSSQPWFGAGTGGTVDPDDESDTSVGDEGAMALAEALQMNTTITMLSLQSVLFNLRIQAGFLIL